MAAVDEPDTSSLVIEVLGKSSDLPTGKKKMYIVRGKSVLVVNDNGYLYAITGNCPHYNFPLEN
ncbi:hypothetical protein GCK32_021829, partial [Trichostrongylus colubriformis]